MSEELYRATVRIDPDFTGFDEKARASIDAGVPDRKSVRIDADTAAAQAQVAALDAEVGKLDRDAGQASRSLSGFSGGLSGIAVGTAALLPALPTLAGGILAVGGALTTAGTAAVAGGGVLVSSIAKAVQANKELEAAQKAVNDATTASGRVKALAEQAALIEKLGPSTIAFGQALKNVGGEWSAFAGSFIPQELQLVTGFERLEHDVLPQLRPLISNTFGVFRDEIGKLDAAVNSPGGHSFFSWLAVEGPRDLRAITDGLGHFGAGFAHLFEASSPLIHQFVDGFDHIGASFDRWSKSLDSNSGFQKFMAEVAKDGPLLVTTLGDAASAIGHIGFALAPVLSLELKFIDGIAKIVADHPAVAAALGGLFLGFQSLRIVSTITGPIGKLFDLLKGANAWMAGTAAAQSAVAASTGAIGVAAATAEAPTGLFLGTIGPFSAVSYAAAGGMNAFAGAEIFAGEAAAGAEAPVAALGATLLSTNAIAGTLLGNLSRIGALGALPLLGVGAMKDTYSLPTNATGDQSLSDLLMRVNSEGKHAPLLGNDKPGLFGMKQSGVSDEDAINYIEQYGNTADLNQLYSITNGEHGRVTASSVSGTVNSSGGDVGRGKSAGGGGFFGLTSLIGGVADIAGKAAANPSVTSYASYYDQFLGGLNNPANFLPLTGGGGGSKAAQTAAQNNAAALAYLLGINIPANLAKGIADGVNPLDQTFQNLNLKLTGTAQTLANALENAFSTALQYGQAAQQSLLPNLVNGLPALGSMTNVTLGANGQLVTTQASPILGGLQLTLGNDKRFVTDIGKARKLGLNSSLIGQFVQAGPSSLDQLDALVNGSPGDIAAINATFGQITALGNQYGYQQALAQGQQQTNALLTQLIQVLVQQVPPAIGKQVGPSVAAALNSVAKAAAQRAAATPGLGPYGG